MDVLRIEPPPAELLTRLLEEHAPLRPVPLCPEIRAHYAHSLVAVWEEAERLAGGPLPAPFWAYPWAGGIGVARMILDQPSLVRGRRVLDFGAGGGVASIAAAVAGAARVVANDIDAWALAVCASAAAAHGVHVEGLHADLCAHPADADDFDVVLCSDLAYERTEAPRQRRVLDRARERGAAVLVGDAGRTYFEDRGMQPAGEFTVPVPADLEGSAERTARVWWYR